MYNRVVDTYAHTLEFVPNCYKTQKICDNPANIFWSARRLQDVLKICLGGLQHVFSITIFRLPRHLEDVSQSPLEDILKTS